MYSYVCNYFWDFSSVFIKSNSFKFFPFPPILCDSGKKEEDNLEADTSSPAALAGTLWIREVLRQDLSKFLIPKITCRIKWLFKAIKSWGDLLYNDIELSTNSLLQHFMFLTSKWTYLKFLWSCSTSL